MLDRIQFLGLTRHFWLTLQLNFKSKQALVYGYLVPLFFLIAFGSVFRSDTPLILHEMGQLLTITILGGACFGMPTALVAERERGIWRRYRLLPVPIASLVAGTLVARVVIIASAAVLQILLARVVYGTPFPSHPVELSVAVIFVASAFLGLGVLIAALADDVPAVQALGQCIFLPTIMIGGVGIPLVVLPEWAQTFSAYMPGRYAVEILQLCVSDPRGLREAGFGAAALAVIGVAAGIVGAKLFRWEAHRRVSRSALGGAAIALAAWVLVGTVAAYAGRTKPIVFVANFELISDAQMQTIKFDNLPRDTEIVSPISPPFRSVEDSAPIAEFISKLKAWPPGHTGDIGQSIRNLVCLATIADVAQDPQEARIARAVFNHLQENFDRDQLKRGLAWIVLSPDDGATLSNVPELGLMRHPPKRVIQSRNVLYAQKFLGRLLGKLKD